MVPPLAHLRVLDLSRVLAGPVATQALADLGAEVIKIERPEEGDDTRRWGPPWLTGADDSRVSAYFLAANRGKRSVTVNFEDKQGQEVIRRLVLKSDVLVENFKVGSLARFALDYESLSALNKRLIYCSITGFGQTGPYALRAGYDFAIQGMGGLMSLTGDDGTIPMKTGVAVADLFTGMNATVAILAALAARERTGLGTHIDMSLLDCQVAMLANQALNHLVTGAIPERWGNAHPSIVPYQAFATRCGHLILAIGNDAQFRRFCTIAGRPELADDPRFATNPARVTNRQAVVADIATLLLARDASDWIEALSAANVPCGPINNLQALFADPQVKARDTAQTLADPVFGAVPTVRPPFRFNGTPVMADKPPPKLGADTDTVLTTVAGFDSSEITRLRKNGVL